MPPLDRPTRSNGADDRPLRTTQILVEQAKAGNQDAFTRLHDLHREAVGRSVTRRLGGQLCERLELDDILQETFLAAWSCLDADGFRDFQTVGGFRSFLVKIALQKVQDAGRKAAASKRAGARTEPLPSGEFAAFSRQPRPSQDARKKELEELREAALIQLDEAQRWLLDAHENLGMNWAELAHELGCKPANAKLKYFRARDHWRELVRKLCGDQADAE